MSRALDILKEDGQLMDIGHVTKEDKKQLEKMIRQGIVAKTKEYFAYYGMGKKKTVYYILGKPNV
jgi:hypothetical protein